MWKNCACDHAKKNGKKERNTLSSSRFLSARAFPSIAHHRRRDRWRWHKPIKYTLVSHLFGYFVSIERRRNNNKKVKVERRKRAVVCAVVDDSPRRNGAGWWKGKKREKMAEFMPAWCYCLPFSHAAFQQSNWFPTFDARFDPVPFFFRFHCAVFTLHLFSFHKFLLMPVICLDS